MTSNVHLVEWLQNNSLELVDYLQRHLRKADINLDSEILHNWINVLCFHMNHGKAPPVEAAVPLAEYIHSQGKTASVAITLHATIRQYYLKSHPHRDRSRRHSQLTTHPESILAGLLQMEEQANFILVTACSQLTNDKLLHVVQQQPRKSQGSNPGFSSSYINYVTDTISSLISLSIRVFDSTGALVFSNNIKSGVPDCDALDKPLPFCCYITKKCRGELHCICDQVMKTGKPHEGEYQVVRDDGVFWYQLFVTPILNREGDVHEILCALRNISVQKHLEEEVLLEQRNTTLAQAALAVAHQLRNPLGVMIGFAELLTQKLPEADRQNAAERLFQNGLRCKRVVENLLQFSNEFKGELATANLQDIIDHLVKPMYTGNQQTRISWKIDTQPCPVDCIPSQLARVFVDLLDNALRASEGVVYFHTQLKDTKILVRVRDFGTGIPRSLHERIFHPFFTTQKSDGALGLGLSLAKAVVDEHGGHIYLADNERISGSEAGATFIVELPLHGAINAVSAIPAQIGTEKMNGKQILLVDDEKDLLDMLHTALQIKGFQVDVAENAEGALKQLDSHTYDCIILDMRLPGKISGRGIYEYILTQNNRLAQNTIFISADTLNRSTRQFLENAGRPYLEKPFMVQDLIHHINQLCVSSSSSSSSS